MSTGYSDKPSSMLTPSGAFAQGLRRIRLHKRILLWLYLINVLFASVLIFPFRRVLDKVSKTDLADEFLEGFSTDAFFDIGVRFGSEIKSLGFAAVGLGALYLLVNVFLAAGIVATLALDHRVSLHRFLAGASRFFSRYLRLFFVSCVTLGAVAAGYAYWVAPYFEDLAEAATMDRDAFLFKAIGVAILLFVVSLVAMVFDYAKILTVADRRRSMIVCACAGLSFSFRRFWRCFRLFYLNLLLVAALTGVFLLVGNQFSNATWGSVIGLFAVQQVFIVCRIGMKLSFFASQLAMYESLAPVPTEAPSKVPVSPVPSSTFRPMDA